MQEDTPPAVPWAQPSILSPDSVSCSLSLSDGHCGPGRTWNRRLWAGGWRRRAPRPPAAPQTVRRAHLALAVVCLFHGAGTESAPLGASLRWRAGTTPCLASLQNFLYKCVGTTLGAASSKEVVRKHLQELLETARYQEERDREVAAPPACVCARASPSHLAQV